MMEKCEKQVIKIEQVVVSHIKISKNGSQPIFADKSAEIL